MLFPEGYSSDFSSYVARAASAAYCIASISLLLTRGREGRKSPSRGCFSTRDIRLCLSLSGAVECPVSRRSWRTAASRHLARGMECRRSEEHTSELQSLMRISYAVFCLKKKNQI